MACLLVTYAGDAFISPNFEIELENVSLVGYNLIFTDTSQPCSGRYIHDDSTIFHKFKRGQNSHVYAILQTKKEMNIRFACANGIKYVGG